MTQVELVGGPLDGRTVDVEDGAVEVVVEMADRTRHRYVPDPADARTFTWAGRR